MAKAIAEAYAGGKLSKASREALLAAYATRRRELAEADAAPSPDAETMSPPPAAPSSAPAVEASP